MVDIFGSTYSSIARAVENLPTAEEKAKNRLALENLALRNARLKQEIAGDAFNKQLQIEKERWNRHLDDVKLTFGIFEKAFSNPALSDASRENMLHLARMMQTSLTPMESAALAGIGSTRILSSDELKAREFDRRFPKPKPPIGSDGAMLPHSDENAPAWARFYLRQAERDQKKAIAIYGLEKGKAIAPVPALIQTDKENVYAYKNPLTNTMGLMNLATDVPEGLIKRAIDAKRTSLSEIAATGMIPDPDQKPQKMYYNGNGYLVESSYDIRTGKHGVMTTPIGPAPPEQLPKTLRNVMLAFGIKDDERREKLLSNPAEAGLFESLQTAMKIKNPTEKASAFANIRAQLLQAFPKNGWMPFVVQQKKGSLLNLIPFRKDTFYLKDSGIIWRRTNGTAQFFDANNEVFTAYTTPSGVAVDANGNDIPGSEGKKSGDTIPSVIARPPKPKQNLTIGEGLGKMASGAVNFGKTTKEIDQNLTRLLVSGPKLNEKGAKKIAEAYAKSWRSGKLLKKEDFVALARDAGIAAQVIDDMFLFKPWQSLAAFGNWLLSLPIPGTEKK